MDLSHLLTTPIAEALETHLTPVPEGDCMGVISDLKPIIVDTKNGPAAKLNVEWTVVDEGVLNGMGRETARVRQQLWLDVDEGGQLLTGPDKNIKLGQLMEVFGLNAAGNGIEALNGKGPALLQIKHSPNPKDAKSPYVDVSYVTKLA